MSILKWFNKPKWQSPNEQVRVTAVQTSKDAELLGQLVKLVNQDSSVKVQIAALNRITDYIEISTIAEQHPNKKVQNIASKKLINWFAQEKNNKQHQVFKKIIDKETIKAIAAQAQDWDIKIEAVQKINQQGFLADLLLQEHDPKIQKHILQQITQPSTLQRLLERTNKKQHALRNEIEKQLGQETKDYEISAIQLCQQLEAVVHGKNSQIVDLSAINSQFNLIETHISDTVKLRYNGAYEAARMILDPKHREDFLHNQKIQRNLAQLKELENIWQQGHITSLKTAQSLIDKLNEINAELLPTNEQNLYESLEKQILSLRDQIQQEQKIPDEAIALVDQLTQVLNQATATPQQLSQFKNKWANVTKKVKNSQSYKQLQEQFQQQCIKLAEKIEQSAKTRDQAAKLAVELIEQANQLIEDGQLSQAKVITNQIAENKKLAGFAHPMIKRNKYQLDQVWNKLKELRNWQKWSNDKVRRDIIKAVAAMHGQGLHPDAVLKKLKDCNEQWYVLEDMEKLPGDKYPSRNQALWQEFRAVSKAVFEPTQPFFEKRNEQQQDKLDQIDELINEMNACDLANTSERDLARMTRNGVHELKALDQLPPKQRGKVAKKLRRAINRIDQKLNEFYQEAENKKIKLIEQVRALHELDDLSSAIEQAKGLQQQWKTAGIVKQHTERKLWKQFRKTNDALFNKREQIKQEINQAQQQQKQILSDFIKAQNKQLKSLKSIEDLNDFKAATQKRWHELENPDYLMQTELNQLLQQADDHIAALNNKALVDNCQLMENLDQLFSQYEQGQLDQQQLDDSLNNFEPELVTTYLPRHSKEYSEEVLQQQLITAEFLTGLETPQEHIEQRMAYQVKVLSDRMSGEKNLQDYVQARNWLDLWFLLPKTDKTFIKNNQKRINQALKAIKKLAYS